MHDINASPTYLTTSELAMRLRVHVGTLARWRTDGTGPTFHRIATHHILYALADVEAWEKSKVVSTVAVQ